MIDGGYVCDTCGAYTLVKHTPVYCISYLKSKLSVTERQLEEALIENKSFKEKIVHADRILDSWR